jgi:hypothetical protein
LIEKKQKRKQTNKKTHILFSTIQLRFINKFNTNFERYFMSVSNFRLVCLLPIYFRFWPTCWEVWTIQNVCFFVCLFSFLFFFYQYYIWDYINLSFNTTEITYTLFTNYIAATNTQVLLIKNCCKLSEYAKRSLLSYTFYQWHQSCYSNYMSNDKTWFNTDFERYFMSVSNFRLVCLLPIYFLFWPTCWEVWTI